MKRKPWWFWTLLGCGGTLTVAIVVLVAAVTWWFLPKETEIGRCRTNFGVDCDRVKPEVIGELTGMTLPPGTELESSSYNRFQDWSVKAVFIVPPDQVGVWEASIIGYPEAAAKGCYALEGRGSDRRCAEVNEPSQHPVRRYTRVTRSDGAVVVHVEAFST